MTFCSTRSLNSRAMIMLILFIVVMFYCMGRVVRLSMLFQSLPSTARMNMSFMLGITSLNERRLTGVVHGGNDVAHRRRGV